MSYWFSKVDFIIVRKTDTLIKFLEKKKEAYIEEERDVSNCGVEPEQGVVQYKNLLYGEEIFYKLYPFTNQG